MPMNLSLVSGKYDNHSGGGDDGDDDDDDGSDDDGGGGGGALARARAFAGGDCDDLLGNNFKIVKA